MNDKKEPRFFKDVFMPAIVSCAIANITIALVKMIGIVSFSESYEFIAVVLLAFSLIRLRSHYIAHKPNKK